MGPGPVGADRTPRPARGRAAAVGHRLGPMPDPRMLRCVETHPTHPGSGPGTPDASDLEVYEHDLSGRPVGPSKDPARSRTDGARAP
ncbi:hypothetical protein AMK22_00490 [Streptomyces sp. CB01580]|nr:hypothetical protein AMK22_00490 [Streptomyces sp. CB01580]